MCEIDNIGMKIENTYGPVKSNYKEPSMIENLYSERKRLEEQLERVLEAIKILRNGSVDLADTVRKLNRAGAY